MDRISLFLRDLNLDGVGLEIGPLHNPMVKREGKRNIRYADHLSRDGLVKKMSHDPAVDPDKIPEIDFIVNSLDDYSNIGEFDYIIASHVIEHTPDFIGWLECLLNHLNPDGRLALAIPDKRYCFDYFRHESTLGEALEAYYERRSRPNFRQVFDFCAKAHHLGTADLWNGAVRELRPFMSASDALKNARKADEGGYVDVHCWCWTYDSFLQMTAQLRELGILPLEVASSLGPQRYWNEFHITLTR